MRGASVSSKRVIIACSIVAGVILTSCLSSPQNDRSNAEKTDASKLERDFPKALSKKISSIESIYFGTQLSDYQVSALTHSQAADLWVLDYASELSALGSKFAIKSREPTRLGQIIVHSYEQKLGGLPVIGGELRIWTAKRNSSIEVIYVHKKLAKAYESVDPKIGSEVSINKIFQGFPEEEFNQFSKPKLVYYLDSSSSDAEARLAWSVVAERVGYELQSRFEFFIDAIDGRVLRAENQIAGVNVSGNVSAYVTPGTEPDTTDNPVSVEALESLTVNLTGGVATSGNTDSDGDYNIVDADAGNVNVAAALLGQRIDVDDALGADLTFSQLGINNGDTVDIVFNGSSQTEYTTAQTNAYFYGQEAYNFFRSRSAAIAGLDAVVKASVNRLNGATNCVAAYAAGEMRFYRSNSSCRNSAYSTVIAHEYGHHFLNVRTLAIADAFAEGFSDAYAMLMFNVDGIGYDLQLDEGFLREPGQAGVQFPCAGDVYTCGQVLSGIWYELRESLGLSTTQQLFVDWAAATAGGSGTNSAYAVTAVEVLTQDDDDANLENGTPHQTKICKAFENHGIECPRLLTFTLGGIPKVIDPLGGTVTMTMVVSGTGALGSPQDSTGVFYYRIDGGAWVQVAMTRTALNTYSVNLPSLSEGQQIDFYFSALTTNGTTAVYPLDAPDEFYTALAEGPSGNQVLIALPSSPTNIFQADLRTGGANRRLFVAPASSASPSLVSFTGANFDGYDLISTSLPEGFNIGSKSLFYRRTEASNEIVFTNNSRTRIYYGSTVSGNLVIDPKFCGDFQKVSAIHITESGAAIHRLIVADEQANKLYSYQINTSNSSLCTSEVVVDLSRPQWIESEIVGAGNPNIYIGNQLGDKLSVFRYQDSNLNMLSTPQLVANHRGAHFGGVLFDNNSSELVVGVANALDATNGDDHIRYFASDFSSTGTVKTCRSPDQITQDHASYVYVFCKSAKKVDLFNAAASYVSLGRFEAGSSPLSMNAVQDGTYRFISILQSNSKVLVHRFAQAATNPLEASTSNTISLAGRGDSLASFGSTDEIYVIGNQAEYLEQLDLTTATVTNTLYLPQSIDSVVAQSASITHFVSKNTDRAYSLEELVTDNFRLRQHPVGSAPVQIGYRTNRLYVLNRDSDNLSIINIAGSPYVTVGTFPTQDRPIAFDFDTVSNQLWAINQGAQSFSTFNIDTAGPEALVAHTALGFVPRKIKYQSSDSTIWIGGGTSLRAINRADRATVKTETLDKSISDLKLITGGVLASSTQGLNIYNVTRAAITETELPAAPDFLATNAANYVVGFPSRKQIRYNSTSYDVNPFSNLLSSSNHFATFEPSDQKIHFFPFSISSSTSIPSVSFELENLVPTSFVEDSSGDFVVADSYRRKILRIDSDYQPDEIQNKILNRPDDIVANDAKDRIYVSLRNMNSIMVYDDLNDAGIIYSVCQRPTKLAFDSVNAQLYVLCRSESLIAVVSLDGNGDPNGLSVIATDKTPVDMEINTAINRLYISNRNSDSVQVINTATNALVTRADTRSHPGDLCFDTSDNRVIGISEGDSELTIFPGATADPVTETYVDTSIRALRRVAVNSGTDTIYALNSISGNVYTGGVSYTGTTTHTRDSVPAELAISEAQDKTVVSFPWVDYVQIYDETGGNVSELAVGDEPQDIYIIEALNNAYVANFSGDSLSVIDLTADTVSATISLASGCGPGRMGSMTVAAVRYLYVICENSDLIEIINTTNNTITSSVSTRLSY